MDCLVYRAKILLNINEKKNYKYFNLTNIERTKNDVHVNSVMLISPSKMMSL